MTTSEIRKIVKSNIIAQGGKLYCFNFNNANAVLRSCPCCFEESTESSNKLARADSVCFVHSDMYAPRCKTLGNRGHNIFNEPVCSRFIDQDYIVTVERYTKHYKSSNLFFLA